MRRYFLHTRRKNSQMSLDFLLVSVGSLAVREERCSEAGENSTVFGRVVYRFSPALLVLIHQLLPITSILRLSSSAMVGRALPFTR